MNKEIVCIVCPNGCKLNISGEEGGYTVTGQKCKRGETFAICEMTMPMRTICSTVKTAFPSAPVLPVRVSRDIPKERIFDVMRELNKIIVSEKVSRGDVIIKNVLDTGADIIATSDILLAADNEKE